MIVYDPSKHVSSYDKEGLKGMLCMYAQAIGATDGTDRYSSINASVIDIATRQSLIATFRETENAYGLVFREVPDNLMPQIEQAWCEYLIDAYAMVGPDRASKMSISDLIQTTWSRLLA